MVIIKFSIAFDTFGDVGQFQDLIIEPFCKMMPLSSKKQAQL